jgi:hypothetical protein
VKVDVLGGEVGACPGGNRLGRLCQRRIAAARNSAKVTVFANRQAGGRQVENPAIAKGARAGAPPG